MKRKILHFTLIELLVVIAIIAILAGLPPARFAAAPRSIPDTFYRSTRAPAPCISLKTPSAALNE